MQNSFVNKKSKNNNLFLRCLYNPSIGLPHGFDFLRSNTQWIGAIRLCRVHNASDPGITYDYTFCKCTRIRCWWTTRKICEIFSASWIQVSAIRNDSKNVMVIFWNLNFRVGIETTHGESTNAYLAATRPIREEPEPKAAVVASPVPPPSDSDSDSN